MQYDSLATMIKSTAAVPPQGPVALILVEDDVEVATTLRHHQQIGFKSLIACMPRSFTLPRDLEDTWKKCPSGAGTTFV